MWQAVRRKDAGLALCSVNVGSIDRGGLALATATGVVITLGLSMESGMPEPKPDPRTQAERLA